MKFDKLTEAYLKVVNENNQTSERKLQVREVSEEDYDYLLGKFPKVKENKFQASGHKPYFYVEYIGLKDSPIDQIVPHRFVKEFVAHF